jgi:hypothetical protein
VAVAGRPVGALSVYATTPCPWSAIDVAAVGAYAAVVAELLRASMALGARDAEVAELTRALTARVWVAAGWPGRTPAAGSRWCPAGRAIATLAAVTATSALSLSLRVAFLRRPPAT